nr:hypothetical protein [Verrucomicrobiota bacterium JB025]
MKHPFILVRLIAALFLLLPATAFSDNPTEALEWCAKIEHWQYPRPSDPRDQQLALIQNHRKQLEPEVRKLADAGNASALNTLGIILTVDPEFNDHSEPAIEYWQKAADAGSVPAMTNLARAYCWNKGMDIDFDKEVVWADKAARKGDPDAMAMLGYLYEKGLGVPASIETAFEWTKKSAELGSPLGMNNLAKKYEFGKGVAQSYDKALEWYRKAAANGRHSAANRLGTIYYKGLGVQRSLETSFKWHLQAAKQGNDHSCYWIGTCYRRGRGVKVSLSQAEKWLRKAVEYDYTEAMFQLGEVLMFEKGMRKDYPYAVSLFRKAAERGDPSSMWHMGRRYADGKGVTPNIETSKMWFKRAADLGYYEAKRALELLAQGPETDPVETAAEATRIYETSGLQAAFDYLDKNRIPWGSPLYSRYFVAIWREAQVKGGRKHLEWRAELYEWLFLGYYQNTRPGKKRQSAIRLIREIVDANLELGRVARFQHFAGLYHQYAREEMGDTISLSKLKDLGSFDEAMPEIHHHEFLQKTRSGAPVDHHPMMAVFNISTQSWMLGDWKTSAEAGLWFHHWGRWYFKNWKKLGGEGHDRNVACDSQTHGLVAAIRVYDLLGFYDLVEKYQTYLFKFAPGAHKRGGLDGVDARKYRVIADLGRGIAKEEHLEILDDNINLEETVLDQIEDSWMLHSAVKADVLFALGRPADGWRELNTILTSLEGKELSYSKAEILIGWARHALDEGKLDGVETKLHEAMQIFRQKGYKIYEPSLYALYARYHYLAGDIDEAIRMQLESIRLHEAIDLYTRVVLEYRTLAQYYLIAGQPEAADYWLNKALAALTNGRAYPQWIIAKASQPLDITLASNSDRTGASRTGTSPSGTGQATSAPAPHGVILQPSAINTAPLPGLPAEATFSLFNQDSWPRPGRLRIDGSIASCKLDGDHLRCTITPDADATTTTVELPLAANQTIEIHLATTVTPETTGEATLAYHEGSADGPHATWSYMPAQSGRTTAMVEAMLVEENPFHMIPAIHNIQSSGSARQIINLRPKASSPTRIEAYLPNGELLFIDAVGNGSLNDRGDVLFVDSDSDGCPDITIDQGVTNYQLTFYYNTIKSDGDTTVELQTRTTNGDWQFDSQDTIRPIR